MNGIIINEELVKGLITDKVIKIAEGVQKLLSKKTAIVQGLNTELEVIDYDTEITIDEDSVSIVPQFDNRVDEYSNSLLIADKNFVGNMTLTKIKQKLTSK